MYRSLAPVEFGAQDILGSLSNVILCTAAFNVEEERATEETVPPHARVPREITIRGLEQAEPEIVQRLEPVWLAPQAPLMPTLGILPLRPAITFAPPAKPAVRREIAVTPPSRSSGPRLVIKATPMPGAAPKAPEHKKESAEHKKEDLAASSASAVVEPAAFPEELPAEELVRAPLQVNPPLTLGLPASDMGSPVFRIWYSTPAKVKVAIVIALVGLVIFSGLSKNTAKPKISPTAGLAATAPVAGFTGGSIAMGGGGWITEWAGDAAGSKRGKQLTLYKPSIPLKDYRTEFVGQIETRSLGWVFRAKDTKNYYAMKIRIVRPGIEPTVVLTRYAVVEGIEGPQVDVPLNLTVRNDTLYTVKVDVQGARFSTYIQGKIADIWSDDRLSSGGFGFSNERGERAHIRSVSVSF
jgi:hypothetical protein